MIEAGTAAEALSHLVECAPQAALVGIGLPSPQLQQFLSEL